MSTAISSPLFLLRSMALQVSPGNGTDRHRHVVAQILLALEDDLNVRLAIQAPISKCAAVLIPPNITHQILGPGPLSLMMWFDPATPMARAIRARSQAEIILLPKSNIESRQSALRQLSLRLKNCSEALYLSKQVIQALLPDWKTVQPLDKRIVATLTAMQTPSLLDNSYPLTRLAQRVNLSEGRLRHLFRQELGVPLQQYWIAYRLTIAIRRLGGHESLTQIAYDAGFADLAHFSRAFRASFGISPSLAQKDSRSVQVISCQN
ncbi:MAG: helix-turn-helix domain-containing protein [Leptolyngbyaceae cyanobacterium MO_188.B28]|nr:helix-turn-helix domain-containing protein [Leptolyngbyaceae cyanobacterium MO_188.B28]